ncbi:putative sulfate exporter family transporter [Micromonospora fiedleri]|uniref:Sulfate exporter family transporter n=1 Tax=Micromonospora fiedleri TaxID=1157498 RepID=A0ABS1UNK7_9ACTN|nr:MULTISPECIES: putative sulfate exporter family transporter [Micromonospora]MBL6277918.1 putative sulfate exporter family transporter [Micromonospora fiedleri]WSK41034.1 putative sulfate exporter family transporter [Micromonospora maris]
MAADANTRSAAEAAPTAGPPAPAVRDRNFWAWTAAGLLVVLLLAALTRYLEQQVPEWAAGTALEDIAAAIEYPVYAIVLGLLGNLVVTLTGLHDRIAAAFRTEFFIKTGLVLLGASINLAVIASAAGPAIAQALLLISGVFLFTWWLAGRLGLDDKLRALLASAVSICGVSAAIAAAGAVRARREQLAYTASLVIVFALPSIFLLPWLADVLGLSPAVAGAWIGGNIDTTAAVTAAGALAGEDALQIASIVKVTQNALMGVVAVALTAYFALHVERRPGSARPGLGELWRRFPKFVLGFVAASVIATWYLKVVGADGKATISIVNDLRTWFFILAFVSIGLEVRVAALRQAGWRPIAVFGAATVFNLVLALGLASLLFAGFSLS